MFTSGPWIWAQTLSVLPLFGVYVGALVLAATNRRRGARRAAHLVFFAATLLLLTLVVQQVFFVTTRMSNFILNTGWSHEQIAWAFVGMGFAMAAFHAAGIFLLVLAAFIDRGWGEGSQ